MRITIYTLIVVFIAIRSSYAIDNSSFSNITRMNSWSTENDIYLVEEHTCTGSDKNLYKLPKTDNQQFSLLLAAFSGGFKVLLNYQCATNDYPEIMGVRVEK